MEEEHLLPNSPHPNSSISPVSSKLPLTLTLSHRSHSAPCIFPNATPSTTLELDIDPPNTHSTPSIVKQAIICITLYISLGVTVYIIEPANFKGHSTFPLVDALYFATVTLCTVGYGDLVPATSFAKLFTSIFILIGFGFIDILLNGLVTYVLDQQEAVLLRSLTENRPKIMFQSYVMDANKGRMRVRMKVGVAVGVVAGCVIFGTVAVHLIEGLGWVDSFYLAVSSVTTVGYGDYAFMTFGGRMFAMVWLLVSTLAVGRAFLFLTEFRIERRNRKIATWVLRRKMTVGDLMAADLDNDGSISKSEFVIYKLKEMGKIAEKDILQICNQFHRLDPGNCGKITLSDLLEIHNH